MSVTNAAGHSTVRKLSDGLPARQPQAAKSSQPPRKSSGSVAHSEAAASVEAWRVYQSPRV